MKILTINLPKSWLKAIDKLVGSIYPSRSEVIRVALRRFILKEIAHAEAQLKEKDFEEEKKPMAEIRQPELFLQTPIVQETVAVPLGNGEMKHYRIVKK